jgi:hypothetical protein
MDKISTFTLNGHDIDMLYNQGKLAYTFEHEGKSYGQKVEVPSRSILDIASATFVLFQSALETLEAVKTNPAHE